MEAPPYRPVASLDPRRRDLCRPGAGAAGALRTSGPSALSAWGRGRHADGTPAQIWPLLPGDREMLRETYEHLSPESRRRRFLTAVPHLTDAMLEHLVDEVDGIDHVALVLVVIGDDHVGTPVGVARMIRYVHEPTAADVAVTVVDEWQGRGVATALLAELVRERPWGVTHIVTTVAADNEASMAMLARLGTMAPAPFKNNRVDVRVELAPPDREERPGT